MHGELPIHSDQAFLAIATGWCWKCELAISVLCIYVSEGMVDGETQNNFTVSTLTAIDDALRTTLQPFHNFQRNYSRMAGMTYFANHCEHCAALQGDFYLHSEPGAPFFPETEEDALRIRFVPIPGQISLSGDVGFGSMEMAFLSAGRRLVGA